MSDDTQKIDEVVEESVVDTAVTPKSLVKSIIAEAKCKKEEKDSEEDDSEDEPGEDDGEELDVSDEDMEDDEEETKKEGCKPKSESVEEEESEVVSEDTTELNISEDVAAMFEGEELSEDFKKKAAMIFEAAVAVRVNAEIATITEELRTEFAAETEKMRSELTEAVDNYTSYAANKWAEENKIAVQKNLKSELVEDFVYGLKSLFAEHYIDLPDEAVDVVEEMTKKVSDLEEQLSYAVKTNAVLTEEVNAKKKVVVLENSITELSENQKEKIRGLVESVKFEREEDFQEKVATLVASYFPKKEPVVTEDVTLPQETLTEEVDPAMAAYTKALSRLK